jgi:hypothetical protein
MALNDLTPRRGPAGRQCTVDYINGLLDDGDRATLAEWLAGDVDPSWIAAAIRDEVGVRLPESSVRRHRRGDCRCGDPA